MDMLKAIFSCGALFVLSFVGLGLTESDFQPLGYDDTEDRGRQGG